MPVPEPLNGFGQMCFQKEKGKRKRDKKKSVMWKRKVCYEFEK